MTSAFDGQMDVEMEDDGMMDVDEGHHMEGKDTARQTPDSLPHSNTNANAVTSRLNDEMEVDTEEERMTNVDGGHGKGKTYGDSYSIKPYTAFSPLFTGKPDEQMGIETNEALKAGVNEGSLSTDGAGPSDPKPTNRPRFSFEQKLQVGSPFTQIQIATGPSSFANPATTFQDLAASVDLRPAPVISASSFSFSGSYRNARIPVEDDDDDDDEEHEGHRDSREEEESEYEQESSENDDYPSQPERTQPNRTARYDREYPDDEEDSEDDASESDGGRYPMNEEIGVSSDEEEDGNSDFYHRLKLIRKRAEDHFPLLRFPRGLRNAGYGKVQLSGPVAGDLDNDIHSVFRQENWIREPRFGKGNIQEHDLLWRRMQPALRLATKLITHSGVMHWWLHVLFSRKELVKGTGRKYLEPSNTKRADPLKSVEKCLERLVRKVQWSFCDMYPPNMDFGQQSHGMTCLGLASLDTHCMPRPAGENAPVCLGEGPQEPVVGLHKSFRDFFLSDGYSNDPESCAVLRLHWQFAVTVTHELAHCFNIAKSPKPDLSEPLLNREDYRHDPELGWTWEREILGLGRTLCYVDSQCGVLGLHWNRWLKSKEDPAITINTDIVSPISPLFLQRFFSKKEWEQMEGLSDREKRRYWHIPAYASVAAGKAPLVRNGEKKTWMWLSTAYPENHRLSVAYWHHQAEARLKKQVHQASAEKARKTNEKREKDRLYHGRVRNKTR